MLKQKGGDGKGDNAHGPINSIYANYENNAVVTGCVKVLLKSSNSIKVLP